MTDAELHEKLLNIFSKKFGVEESNFLNANIKTVESWDSFSHMDLMLELEAEFQLHELSGEDFANLVSVARIMEYIKRPKGE